MRRTHSNFTVWPVQLLQPGNLWLTYDDKTKVVRPKTALSVQTALKFYVANQVVTILPVSFYPFCNTVSVIDTDTLPFQDLKVASNVFQVLFIDQMKPRQLGAVTTELQ